MTSPKVLTWCILCVVGGRASCQPPPTTVTVTGVVVAADGETPVTGMTVELAPEPGPEARPGGYRERETATDETGRFEFPRVPEGRYHVAITERWHAIADRPLRVRHGQKNEVRFVLKTHGLVRARVLDVTGQPLAGRSVLVTVSYCNGLPDNEWQLTANAHGEVAWAMRASTRADIGVRVPGAGLASRRAVDLYALAFNLGDIRLLPGASLSGTVLSGETRLPLAEVGIQAEWHGGSEWLVFGDCLYTTTDANGRWRFDALPPAEYDVGAEPAGFVELQIGGLRLEAGVTRDGITLALEPGISVAGQVVAGDGETPVRSARVYLQPSTEPGKAPAGLGPELDDLSRDDGRFEIGPVARGRYVLTVGAELEIARQELDLRVTGEPRMRLVLRSWQVVRGRLLDPHGTPLKGRTVVAMPLPDGKPDEEPSTLHLQTDQEGRFRLAAACERSFDLALWVEDTGWWRRADIRVAGEGLELGDVKLNGGVGLEVIVRNDATVEPVRDARVEVQAPASAGLPGGQVDGITDEAGCVRFGGLPPGTYAVDVACAGYAGGDQTATLEANRATEEVTVLLEPLVRVSGVVRCGETQQPVGGVRVHWSHDAEEFYEEPVETAVDGSFHLEVSKGTYFLRTERRPYLPVTRKVEVGTGAVQVVVTLAERGVDVRGTVTGDGGHPLVGVRVAAMQLGSHIDESELVRSFRNRVLSSSDDFPWDNPRWAVTETDEQGRYVLTGLAPGDHFFCCPASGVPVAYRRTVSVRRDTPTEVHLHAGWHQPLLVRGRLTDADGAPMTNTSVYLQCTQGELPARADGDSLSTGEDGGYWFRVDEPGTYDLTLSKPALGKAERKGLVISGDQVLPELDLQFAPPPFTRDDFGSISGTVHLADGKTPAAGAFVVPFREGEENWPGIDYGCLVGGKPIRARLQGAAAADEAGTFTLTDLPPGTYGLAALPWRPHDRRQPPESSPLAGTTYSVVTGIRLAPKQALAGVELTLRAGAMICGRVVEADSGRPLASARIVRSPQSAPAPDTQYFGGHVVSPEVVTDADGAFAVPCLPQGTYVVSASATDHEDAGSGAVAVKPGQRVTGVELKLVRTFRGAIEGVILLPDARTPAAGAKVYLPTYGYHRPWALAGRDGRFRIEGLSKEPHRVVVTYPGCAPAVVADAQPAQGDVVAVTIQLHTGGSVRGTVSVEGGAPVPARAHVLLQGEGTERDWADATDIGKRPGLLAAVVDNDGTFSLGPVAPGRYVAEVWAGGKMVATQGQVVVEDRRRTAVSVTVRPANGIVRGRITLADEATLRRPHVALVAATPRAAGQAQVHDMPPTAEVIEGRYAIEHIPAGQYLAILYGTDADGPRPGEIMYRSDTPVSVANDRPAVVDFSIPAGSAVSGVVVMAENGQPVSGATVATVRSEVYQRLGDIGPAEFPRFFATTRTGEDGSFILPGVLPGRYTFSAHAGTVERLSADSPEVVVEAGKPTGDVRIELGESPGER